MKISICEAAPMGACSFYRSIGPFSKLRHLNQSIHVNTLANVNWNNLYDTDILVLARPDSDSFITMAKMAKELNIPVWIDWDDNIHEIPEYNPAYKHYRKEKTMKYIEKCAQFADVITVTTPALKEFYSKFNKNVRIIENALNDYNYKLERISDQSKTIFWRGSNTHRQDLLSIAKEMFAVSRKYEKDWSWVFVGGDPWYITDNIKNYFSINDTDIGTYQKFIKENKSAILQFPLLVNNFNRSKSNIAWIEGTYSGSSIIAPLLPEFERPGITNYTEKEGSYQYNLEKLINDPKLRKKNYNLSFDFIQENLLLSTINQKRIKIIEEII